MQLVTLQTDADTWQPSALPPLDSPSTLILVFGAPELARAPALFAGIAYAYPSSHVLGCSTAGEIFDAGLSDGSLAIAVARFDATRLATACAPISTPHDSYAAGESIARRLYAPDLRGLLVLSDGLNINGSELVRGLNAVLPAGVSVTGGLAGDGDRFKRTWVLHDGVPSTGVVAAVGFYGEHVQIGHGSKGGWDMFGPERQVTRSQGNTLYELDGRPALELYKTYLGERASELPASALLFPLSVRAQAGDDRRVVRTVLAVDEARQSLTFAGDVPEGHLAQLMRANFDRLIDGAADAALMTRGAASNGGMAEPVLSVAISCVGRRLVLGERTEEELEATLDALPPGTRQVGFYSYGEISPFATGHCDLHNQTMTLTTICEN